MDNASNCDKLAKFLGISLPSFPGMSAWLQCLADIFNLIAKIFISIFFKKPKSKKKVGIAAGAQSGGFQWPGESTDLGEAEVNIFDENDSESEEEEDIAVQEASDEALEVENDNEGQEVHNEKVAKILHDKAISIMAKKGITISSEEEKNALQIFPHIAGLACHIHNSPTLKEKFDKIVAANETLTGHQHTLSCCCLLAHFHFRNSVKELTDVSSNNLQAYALNDEQWQMADDIFTHIFSTADVPLIVDVFPTLEELCEGLIGAHDDTQNDVANYSIFAADNEIYIIAVVMCPDHKLKWFKDHGHNITQIKGIEKMVVNQWKDFYASPDMEDTDTSGRQQPVSNHEIY
ncbi:hypothetical protein BDQ12DRAFT_699834 [Crucibulum laeve]|uniref:Uncharacterized protein n=1 Tax=Crucibulum laeve TaxID=68775 RepID=A0A5C3LTA4_9AGAR|nr:hypothetical protein BDQ12DRAFT_699834 [Crucibulum laeve]